MSKKTGMLIFGIVIATILAIVAAIFVINGMKNETEALPVIHNGLREVSDSPFKSWEETVQIGAIGDILIHDWVYEDAQKGNRYDFKPMFQYVKKPLQAVDLLLANQETILGGVELGVSSYPMFNSPQEVGDALIDSGVDIVSTANNHTLDKGEKGILNAIQYYERVGLPYVGHFKNEEDQKTLRIITKNGISFAFLSYTYGTNGIPVPKGKPYLVNLIDLPKMKEEIKRAREQADIVVMSIHWGYEYQRFPSDEQKLIAYELAKSGVDIIFGHHPHVLQPMEWIEVDGRKVFVVYSLGNFLSGQMWDYKDIGGLATILVTKKIDKNGSTIKLSNPQFLPTYVSNKNLRNYRVVPLENAEPFGLKNAQKKYEEIMNHMFQWMK